MPPVQTFRTGLYLSLAIAILAIGVAGGDLLPELPFITGLSLVMFGAIYFVESRWQLSLRNANLVGFGLLAALGLWVIFQIVRPPTGISATLPWPASALPYMAPVLMILIPAKMLRPKHIGDYWTMHGLGLLAMALACALAVDGSFVLVFIAYAVVFVWSLANFQLYRQLGPELAARKFPLGRWHGLATAALSAVVASVLAIPLFWATPRSGANWELALNARGHSATGLGDGSVDLNRTGTIDVNSDKAFEIHATKPNGQPYLDLPSDLRFSAVYLHNYEGGRWVRNQSSMHSADRAVSPPNLTHDPFSRLPDLGPGTVRLNYILAPRLSRTPPIAEPVAWRSGQFAPILSRYADGGYRSWIHKFDGSFDGAFDNDDSPPQYLQAWAPPSRPGESPAFRVSLVGDEYLTPPNGLPRLKSFTDRLVERLVGEGKLPPSVLTDVDVVQKRNKEHHEEIARALAHYLSSSGEFSYSLELTRQDTSIDPTEDFCSTQSPATASDSRPLWRSCCDRREYRPRLCWVTAVATIGATAFMRFAKITLMPGSRSCCPPTAAGRTASFGIMPAAKTAWFGSPRWVAGPAPPG